MGGMGRKRKGKRGDGDNGIGKGEFGDNQVRSEEENLKV